MDISVERLLNKMEEKIREAKETSSDAVIRERIHAIKTMCELVLEEPLTTTKVIGQSSNPTVSTSNYSGGVSVPVPPVVSQGQQQRLVVDDEANGESIFDF